MSDVARSPCDDGVVAAGGSGIACDPTARRWVLAATVLGSSMVFINGSTVNVALPALQSALGANLVDVQWVVNGYTLLLAALILIGGSLGDHLGRRRVFLIGIGVFTVASIACGLAPGVRTLIAARLLQGVGGALLTPGSLAILSAAYPRQERGQAIGLWSGFSALTAALGPLLGGWLIDTLSWRWIFFINLPLALATVAITLRWVPESRDPEASDAIDWRGAVLVTLGLAGLTYGLLASSNRSFADPRVVLALAGGAALLAAFVWAEATSDEPMVPLRFFREPSFAGANLLTLLLYTGFGGALFFLPFNLIQIQGYSATAAGAAFLPTILLLSLLSRWAGGLVPRVGAKLPLVLGPLLVAGGFLLFLLPGTDSSYWLFLPALVVLGVGMAVSVAPLTTVVMAALPDHVSGTASGINNAASRVAGLLAVAVFGVVLVTIYADALGTRLARLELPPEVRRAIDVSRTDLAATEVPQELGPELSRAVAQAIEGAFVTGFRGVMLLAAALAVASALVAWTMIGAPVGSDGGDGAA